MIPIRRILPRGWLAFCSLTLLAAAGTFAFSVRRMRSQESQPPRTVFVHLFEWRWQDIARECEVWLSPKGYAAVQISPPNEHRVIYRPDWNPAVEFPWYQRYQPVSYKLHSRSGTRTELEDMVRRCNDVGVKIYADIVFNHMVISDTGSEIGIAGSPFSTELRSYPAVPYNTSSFREDACIIQPRDYRESADRVRRCQLNGLQDLKTDDPQVQQRIADYMNDLISIGVAGFRLDASKHVHPDEIAGILARVDNLNSKFHPQGGRPFVFQEVIDLGGERSLPENISTMDR
ncbi:MAG: hypothetical protein HC925_00955 [Coleofasciculaceae cyanobacterium SM2_3_26]|nr:hypothetical protein [Coleofasciculaceae cyanobacterium SM2_3_26]